MTARITLRAALSQARSAGLLVQRAGQHWRVTYGGVYVTVHGTSKDAPRALLMMIRDAVAGRPPRRRGGGRT